MKYGIIKTIKSFIMLAIILEMFLLALSNEAEEYNMTQK
jgi:hypothetical protein